MRRALTAGLHAHCTHLERHVLAVALAHDEGVLERDEERDKRAGQAGHRDGAAAAQHAEDVRAGQRRARYARLQACVRQSAGRHRSCMPSELLSSPLACAILEVIEPQIGHGHPLATKGPMSGFCSSNFKDRGHPQGLARMHALTGNTQEGQWSRCMHGRSMHCGHRKLGT